jgi:hypothetical protein
MLRDLLVRQNQVDLAYPSSLWGGSARSAGVGVMVKREKDLPPPDMLFALLTTRRPPHRSGRDKKESRSITSASGILDHPLEIVVAHAFALPDLTDDDDCRCATPTHPHLGLVIPGRAKCELGIHHHDRECGFRMPPRGFGITGHSVAAESKNSSAFLRVGKRPSSR